MGVVLTNGKNVITITYDAEANVKPEIPAAASICSLFTPGAAAADLPAFEGTYYDTNVPGWGEATSIEQFIAQQVSNPNILAAIRLAVAEGEVKLVDADNRDALYAMEIAKAVEEFGFTIEVTTGE